MASSVGKRIRKYRELRNMTQDELAKKLGYKVRSTVSHFENLETPPSTNTLKRIADALQCDMVDLLYDVSEIQMNEGVGICTNSLEKFFSLKDLVALKRAIPSLKRQIENFADQYNKSSNKERSQNFAELLKNIVKEKCAYKFITVEDQDGNFYLLYNPKFPWEMEENEKEITAENVMNVFLELTRYFTDEPIQIKNYSVCQIPKN